MSKTETEMAQLPVAIVGAGPVGLAAAAHLHQYGVPFVVLEEGEEAGSAIRQWGHVRVFTPWRYNIDKAARKLLEASGWQPPAEDDLPLGHEILDRYIKPLAEHEAIRPHLRLGAKVRSISRKNFDKVKTSGREAQPFELWLDNDTTLEARAVIDASGTWRSPNPMGSSGIPAVGESEFAHRISYGIPDVLDREKERYAGKRVLVVGSGHSAINALLELLELQKIAPSTRVTWAMRRENVASIYGGEAADALPARGRLGTLAREAIASGRLELLSPFRIRRVSETVGALTISGQLGDEPHMIAADEIIVATGFRPDLAMLREVRLSLDPWLEATETLAPLIDPNLHSCGTVRPHGARELEHHEKDFFIIGMKSYGRAPTFLMATGFEQARSVAAWLAGDVQAALRVELDLPETGVCGVPGAGSSNAAGDVHESEACCGVPAPRDAIAGAGNTEKAAAGEAECGCGTPEKKETDMTNDVKASQANPEEQPAASGCCGGPAPAGVEACCVKDADAKAAGESGCGCGSTKKAEPEPQKTACCG